MEGLHPSPAGALSAPPDITPRRLHVQLGTVLVYRMAGGYEPYSVRVGPRPGTRPPQLL